MVTIIPRRLRFPVSLGMALLGVFFLFTSYTRWQEGPFYGTSINAGKIFVGLVVLAIAFYVFRHQDN
jgi:hypothetical protein